MTTPTVVKHASEIERFIARTVVTEHGLLWRGGTNKDGYGVFRLDGGHRYAPVYVHRYWWTYNNKSSIPDGLHVDHSCHLRRCLTHLQLLDSRANSRKIMRSRRAHKLRLAAERRVYRPITTTTMRVSA